MKKETMVCTDFWSDSEGVMMTPQDKYFYLYLLSNSMTNHIGIYQITRKKWLLIWAIVLRLFIC
jgi:hypothetical protein